ncbi:MurR/RpiR family transcriptional regulator [Halocynthiibacter namhaensis]|uniref:MurR/RpiR family transcriptional regulator n=1 Tax=Halocynthiibacter namhaensis TaxID=1290553 RepID=UPI0005791C67|nr:MurR/RpiR family transcriptional regulator [Halocynthiibacter namhaensis]
MKDFLQINDSLREMHPDLPRALKVVAAYLLEHPGDVATLSMRQVATNAGVSLPNFSRLAKMLGYETYGELREIYRKQVQLHDASYYHLRAETLHKPNRMNDSAAFLAAMQESVIENTQQLFSQLDSDYLEEIAQVLTKCRRVYLVGMQASHSFMMHLNFLGGMASDKFQLIRSEGGVFADDITDLGAEDAVVVLSQQPSAHATIQLAQLSKARDATVIAISDSPISPLALLADFTVLTPNQSPMFFESYVSATIIIEAIIGFFTLEQTADVVARIERIEADRIQLGEYWTNKET